MAPPRGFLFPRSPSLSLNLERQQLCGGGGARPRGDRDRGMWEPDTWLWRSGEVRRPVLLGTGERRPPLGDCRKQGLFSLGSGGLTSFHWRSEGFFGFCPRRWRGGDKGGDIGSAPNPLHLSLPPISWEHTILPVGVWGVPGCTPRGPGGKGLVTCLLESEACHLLAIERWRGGHTLPSGLGSNRASWPLVSEGNTLPWRVKGEPGLAL